MKVWWEPLAALRFVTRDVNGKSLRILQQMWAQHRTARGWSHPTQTGEYRWIDVPLQDEDTLVDANEWTKDEL